jgi:Glycosyl transferases group 1
LLGSLSQGAVIEKLRVADIFALASVTDRQGASDVFPTVIIEGMAVARPVVSTRLAGIPELVAHGETGLLVAPGDTSALAQALEELIRDPGLRSRYGRAGRARIEQHFRIEHTVAPLLQRFETASTKSGQRRASQSEAATESHQIAYLIDRWPDKDLPLIERELEEMKRRGVSIVPFVCELNSAARLNRSMERMAPWLEFLPDTMVIEAEWRANPALAQKLEEARAQQESRSPSAIFMRQARFALVLRRLLMERKISHVHATTSRALVCALILQKIGDVTVSATIEPRPELPRDWVKAAMPRCVGGRVHDRKLFEAQNGSFVLDKTGGFHLTGRTKFWQQWAELLLRWSCSDQKSKIENRK